MQWSIYIVQCADGTLYTGSTNDVKKRVKEHNSLHKGAKYTRTRQPVKLVYQELVGEKGSALSREYMIKQLSRSAKLALIKKTRQKAI